MSNFYRYNITKCFTMEYIVLLMMWTALLSTRRDGVFG